MKKLLAVMCILTLSCLMLAGCSKGKQADDKKTPTGQGSMEQNSTEQSSTEQSSTEQSSGGKGQESVEPVTIKVSYPCLVIVPPEDSVVAVEETINKHLEEKGSRIRMKLEAMDANNYMTSIDMKQIGGEEVDLYMCLGGIADQVTSNKVLPLSAYTSTALKPILEITGETILDATTFNGEVYGVPCYKTSVLTYYWVCDYEVASQELGLKEGDTYTMEELTAALGKLHENHPDRIAMAVRPGANGTANNFCLNAIYGGPDYYTVTDLNNGVCIVGDDTTVVNKYDTEYFKTVCETAYQWNQAGYVNKDASVVTEEGYDLVKAGRALSYIIGFGGYNPRVTDAEEDIQHGKSVIYVPVEPSLNMPTGLDWCVSYGCKDPEAACEALSLFYTDPFVMNTLLYGVEGRDYIDTGLGTKEDKVIDYPEGLDMFTVPYTAGATCGIMGNEFIDWIQVESDGTFEDRRQANKEFMESAVASPIFGFALNPESVKGAVASISNVESQYLGGLLTGELNPDEYIPKFVQALKDAGIDEVIQEAQTQLNTWLEANQ